MPPKKSSRSQQASSSQPVEPQRQTRAGRKRAHSDASEADAASERPSSSHSINTPSIASTPAKRRKRVKTTTTSVEPEVIVEEEEEEIEETLKAAPECDADAMEGAETHEESSYTYAKHVHFPGGRQSQTIALNDDDELERTTATHITPHPRKTSLKRRITVSPGLGADGEKRTRISSSRHSLPPALLQNGELYYTVDQHNMAPLSEVLAERIRVRMEIHAKRDSEIKLLEAQRPLLEGAELDEVDSELVILRDQQKHTFDALTVVEGEDTLDPEMLVLESQQETAYPDLLQDSTQIELSQSKIRQSLSQSFSQRSKEQEWETEREQFRSVIVTLSDQANEAKTKLQILQIELQNLGLGEGVDSRTIISSIRESFIAIREGLENALPGSIPEGASNADIIEILLADVKEFATRLRTQDQELYEKSNLVVSLSGQVDGLIDHLAEAKIEIAGLRQVRKELEDQLETKVELEKDHIAEIDQIADERDANQDELDLAIKRIEEFELTVTELTLTVEKLTASLTHYRTEESRLTALITRIEKEHKADVVKMNKEREETVRDLDARIDEQTQLREEAEALAEERHRLIVTLEGEKTTVEQERDTLQSELEEMTTQRDAEHDAREDAEMDLRARTGEVENLEDRVDRLEEQLTELNAQIDQLRELSETERTQREAAEADLDTANAEIEKLEAKLKASGTEANGLRQKLWQVQQTNDQKIKELEQDASERDTKYQIDIKEEVDRREIVEADLQDREDAIEDLKAQLSELEENMATILAERDARILSLEQELVDRNAEIEELTTDLGNTEERYQLQVAQSQEDREEFERSIAALQITITTHETLIATLQQETIDESALHASEIEDRNARIAQLNHEVAEFTEQVHELQTEKTSLERRVEQEAEAMLELQAAMGDEIDALKAVVADKQAKIAVVEQKAVEADERWQEVLAAREEEIRLLHEQSTTTEEEVITVTTQNAELRRKFAEYVRRTSAKIRTLRAENDRARAIIDQEGEAILIDGEAELLALEEMESVSEMVTVQKRTVTNGSRAVQQSSSSQSQSHSAQSSKKTRSKKKGRVMDSGIGMEEDESLLPST